MSKAKLRKKIRRLKRENLELIIECNAAMARSGEAHEELQEQATRLSYVEQLLRPNPARLNG